MPESMHLVSGPAVGIRHWMSVSTQKTGMSRGPSCSAQVMTQLHSRDSRGVRLGRCVEDICEQRQEESMMAANPWQVALHITGQGHTIPATVEWDT
jgi:hypothetical protein